MTTKNKTVQKVVEVSKAIVAKVATAIDAGMIELANTLGKQIAESTVTVSELIRQYFTALALKFGNGKGSEVPAGTLKVYRALFINAIAENHGDVDSVKVMVSRIVKEQGFVRGKQGNGKAKPSKPSTSKDAQGDTAKQEDNLLDFEDTKNAVKNLTTIFRSVKAAHGDDAAGIVKDACKRAGINIG